jgi:hypothetical protein
MIAWTYHATGDREAPMTNPFTEITPEFKRGWDAAVLLCVI